MNHGRRFGFSAEQKRDVWRRWKAGQTLHEIGRAFGKEHSSIRCLVSRHGGIAPAVRRHTPTWRKEVGRRFSVGYYSRKDGLDCIWLVNENGEYEQTTDRKGLLKYFEIERLSDEKNFYGAGKRRLAKLKKTASAPARS